MVVPFWIRQMDKYNLAVNVHSLDRSRIVLHSLRHFIRVEGKIHTTFFDDGCDKLFQSIFRMIFLAQLFQYIPVDEFLVVLYQYLIVDRYRLAAHYGIQQFTDFIGRNIGISFRKSTVVTNQAYQPSTELIRNALLTFFVLDDISRKLHDGFFVVKTNNRFSQVNRVSCILATRSDLLFSILYCLVDNVHKLFYSTAQTIQFS